MQRRSSLRLICSLDSELNDDHLGSSDGSRFLTHASVVNLPLVRTGRSRHLAGPLTTETSVPRHSVCRASRNGGLSALRVGQRQGRNIWEDPTSSREKTTRSWCLRKAPSTRSALRVARRTGDSSAVSSSDHRTRPCLAATRSCSGARTCENDRKHASSSQTSECLWG